MNRPKVTPVSENNISAGEFFKIFTLHIGLDSIPETNDYTEYKYYAERATFFVAPWGGLSYEYFTEDGLMQSISRAEVAFFIYSLGAMCKSIDDEKIVIDGSITDISHLYSGEERWIYACIQFDIIPADGNKFYPYAGVSHDEAVQFLKIVW